MSDHPKSKKSSQLKKKKTTSSKSKEKDKESKKGKTKSSKSKKEEEPNKNASIDLKDSTNLMESTILPQNLLPIQNPPLQPQNDNIQSNDKCEGCFQGEGFCFCSTCGKIFCKICDDQLHMVPVFKSHERTPLSVLSTMNMKCYHHGQSLRYYCQSCEEPICNQCIELGPHNNVLHKTSPLFEFYKTRFLAVKEKVDGVLSEKIKKIESLMMIIESKIKETKTVGFNLTNGINKEFELVNESLNKCSGKKMAMLNYNCAMIQKDILAINSILDFLESTKPDNGNNYLENGSDRMKVGASISVSNRLSGSNDNNNMIKFLLQYKGVNEALEKIISKPSNAYNLTMNEVEQLYTWPSDFNNANDKLLQFDKMKLLLKIKEDIIWNLLTREHSIPEIEQIKADAQKEISEWSKLSDKYAKEMQKYNLVCAYCGCYLDNIKVNDVCPKNNRNKFTDEGYTKEFPPEEFNGNKRHFFTEPTEEYASIITRELPSLDDNPYAKKKPNAIFKENKEEIKKKMLKKEFQNDWIFSMAKLIEKENINLFQVLNDIDMDGDGMITPNELLAGLSRVKIFLSPTEKESLLKYLSVSNNWAGKVNIKEFSKNFMRKKSKAEKENFEKATKIKDSLEVTKTIKFNNENAKNMEKDNPFNHNYINS